MLTVSQHWGILGFDNVRCCRLEFDVHVSGLHSFVSGTPGSDRKYSSQDISFKQEYDKYGEGKVVLLRYGGVFLLSPSYWHWIWALLTYYEIKVPQHRCWSILNYSVPVQYIHLPTVEWHPVTNIFMCVNQCCQHRSTLIDIWLFDKSRLIFCLFSVQSFHALSPAKFVTPVIK